MTLAHYKISENARQIAQASGFDIDNPDKRYPVHNPQMEQVMAERGHQMDARARLLLKGRKVMSRTFGRGHTS